MAEAPPVRTDYFAHDEIYRRHRQDPARTGWDTEEGWAEESAELDRMRAWPEFPAEGSMLELGCGAGQQSLKFAQAGFRVAGIDISPTAVEWAREHAENMGLDADFRVGDVRTLEGFDDASFDAVLDGHLLHCIIGEDRPLVLAAARRVLREDGTFVIRTMCDPNPDNPPPNFDFSTHYSMRSGHPGVAGRYVGPAEAILEEITAAGFEVVREERLPAGGKTNGDLLAIAIKRDATFGS